MYFGNFARKQALLDLMNIQEGYLPFTYLGAPIFKGASNGIYFKKIVDRISAKFVSWTGMLLSMAERAQLV